MLFQNTPGGRKSRSYQEVAQYNQVIGNSKDEQQTKKNQHKLHELIELLCRLNRVRDDHLTFRAARTRLFFLPLKNQIFFLHDKSAFFSNFTKISC
jgi:hypothetical protein